MCQRGTYSFTGWPECITCSAGYACPSIFGKGIISCALGTYSLDMSTVSTDQLGNSMSYCVLLHFGVGKEGAFAPPPY